jgi:hypothetical protein
MANEKNLEKGRATRFRSGEDAAKKGKKGGIESGKKRRHLKELKEACAALLESKHEQSDGAELTGAEMMALRAFKSACKGDWDAWKLIRDTSGQKPIERAVISNIEPQIIKEVEAMVKSEDEENGSD